MHWRVVSLVPRLVCCLWRGGSTSLNFRASRSNWSSWGGDFIFPQAFVSNRHLFMFSAMCSRKQGEQNQHPTFVQLLWSSSYTIQSVCASGAGWDRGNFGSGTNRRAAWIPSRWTHRRMPAHNQLRAWQNPLTWCASVDASLDLSKALGRSNGKAYGKPLANMECLIICCGFGNVCIMARQGGLNTTMLMEICFVSGEACDKDVYWLTLRLFLFVLELAFGCWCRKAGNAGVDFQDGMRTLLDLRFADGIPLFPKTFDATKFLLDELVTCLAEVGLQFHVGKTKILTTQSQSPGEVPLRSGKVIDVLDHGSPHTWLECLLCTANTGNHTSDLAHHLHSHLFPQPSLLQTVFLGSTTLDPGYQNPHHHRRIQPRRWHIEDMLDDMQIEEQHWFRNGGVFFFVPRSFLTAAPRGVRRKGQQPAR